MSDGRMSDRCTHLGGRRDDHVGEAQAAQQLAARVRLEEEAQEGPRLRLVALRALQSVGGIVMS